MDGFLQFLMENLEKSVKGNKHKPLVKLKAEDVVKFETLKARGEATKQEVLRLISKFDAERDRVWADVKDAYGLHGKNLHLNEENELCEILD